MVGMSYLVFRGIIVKCKRYFLHGKKGTFGQFFLHWRSLHNKVNCETLVLNQRKDEEWQRTCGLHVSSISSLLLCGFAYRVAHERCGSSHEQRTDDSLDALGCCQRNSDQKLNTQLLFTGSRTGMQRMSAVWVCPWMKGAHKMCTRQPLKQSSFQRIVAGNFHHSVSLHRLND